MARSAFKALFYINRSKQKKSGNCPIMGRITIDGSQVQYSTGQEIHPDLWDNKKSRSKGTTVEARNINRHLDDWETKIQAKHQEMLWQKGYFSAELLK